MVCPTVFPWSCCRADEGSMVQCGSLPHYCAMSLTVFDTASRHAATTLQTVLLPTLACVVRMMLLTTPLSCRRAAVCKRYTRRRAYHHTAVYTVHSTTTAALPAVPWWPHPVLRHLPLATLVDWFHGHASHYPLRQWEQQPQWPPLAWRRPHAVASPAPWLVCAAESRLVSARAQGQARELALVACLQPSSWVATALGCPLHD